MKGCDALQLFLHLSSTKQIGGECHVISPFTLRVHSFSVFVDVDVGTEQHSQ